MTLMMVFPLSFIVPYDGVSSVFYCPECVEPSCHWQYRDTKNSTAPDRRNGGVRMKHQYSHSLDDNVTFGQPEGYAYKSTQDSNEYPALERKVNSNILTAK